MKRVGFLAIASALSGLLLPTAVIAQLRVIPEFGVDWSPSDLGDAYSSWGTRYARSRTPSAVIALSLELPARSMVRLRISGVQCLKADVPVEGPACAGPRCDVPTRIRAVSAAVVLSHPLLFSNLSPFLIAGGGAKRWDFGFSEGSQVSYLFSEDYLPTLVLGAGLNWDLGALDGVLTLSDFVSRSPVEERRPQHDILVTLGLAYNLRIPLS